MTNTVFRKNGSLSVLYVGPLSGEKGSGNIMTERIIKREGKCNIEEKAGKFLWGTLKKRAMDGCVDASIKMYCVDELASKCKADIHLILFCLHNIYFLMDFEVDICRRSQFV